MNETARILVIDDDPQLVRVLRTGLKSRGYDVRTAPDGKTALDIFNESELDLVITDLGMPKMNGLEVCRQLRSVSQVPIIVLSAKGEEKTKIEALDLGADDFVTKPFGIDELFARVRAALRRSVATLANNTAKALTFGVFKADLETRRVSIEGRQIHLTPKEFDLLIFFMNNAGKVLTHRTLLSAIWGSSYVEQNEYLRVFVGQLRKKVEPEGSKPRYILTEP